MNTLDVTNQALALLLRSYSGCSADELSDEEHRKMVARAKTIITIGHGLLQKLEQEVLSGTPG